MCKTCKHAIFDPLMGEYKCIVDQTYVYRETLFCEDYKEGKPVESKRAKDYYEQMGMSDDASN